MSASFDRHWLITAFEPFGGRPSNNSKTVLDEIKTLARQNEGAEEWGFKIHTSVLPVEYDRCHEELTRAQEDLLKEGILLQGILSLGEGDSEFKLETQANNMDDVEGFPDNAGVIRTRRTIIQDFPPDEVLPLKFPFEAFSRIRPSKSPGYFVCNHLCARMAHESSKKLDAPVFGFIHVPKTGAGGMFTPDVCARVIVNGLKKLSSI